MATTNYIPFQNLAKVKIYKLLNYGKSYSNYTSFKMIDNLDGVICVYVDKEPYKVNNLDDTKTQYHVEIHFTPHVNKPPQKIILTNQEIDTIIEKYGSKL